MGPMVWSGAAVTEGQRTNGLSRRGCDGITNRLSNRLTNILTDLSEIHIKRPPLIFAIFKFAFWAWFI